MDFLRKHTAMIAVKHTRSNTNSKRTSPMQDNMAPSHGAHGRTKPCHVFRTSGLFFVRSLCWTLSCMQVHHGQLHANLWDMTSYTYILHTGYKSTFSMSCIVKITMVPTMHSCDTPWHSLFPRVRHLFQLLSLLRSKRTHISKLFTEHDHKIGHIVCLRERDQKIAFLTPKTSWPPQYHSSACEVCGVQYRDLASQHRKVSRCFSRENSVHLDPCHTRTLWCGLRPLTSAPRDTSVKEFMSEPDYHGITPLNSVQLRTYLLDRHSDSPLVCHTSCTRNRRVPVRCHTRSPRCISCWSSWPLRPSHILRWSHPKRVNLECIISEASCSNQWHWHSVPGWQVQPSKRVIILDYYAERTFESTTCLRSDPELCTLTFETGREWTTFSLLWLQIWYKLFPPIYP